MKKFLALIIASLTFTGMLFAEAPAFTDENAYVIDATKLPETIKDYVKLTNVSMTTNFEVTIYGWHEIRKEWLEFGKSRLYGIGDEQTVKSVDKYNRPLSSFRYIAVTNNANKKFRYSETAANKDLHIWFYDDHEIDPSHFKTFDLSILPSFSDNFKIVADKKFSTGASFKVEVYNDESEENKDGTIAVLKGPKASQTFAKTSKGKKFGSYHFIKIISREARDFKYTVNVERNDLVITVSE